MNAVVLVIGGHQISIAKYLRGGIYPHVKFERDRLNSCRVRVFTSSGSTGGRGGDAKTIISPNTSFGDIITLLYWIHYKNIGFFTIKLNTEGCVPPKSFRFIYGNIHVGNNASCA